MYYHFFYIHIQRDYILIETTRDPSENDAGEKFAACLHIGQYPSLRNGFFVRMLASCFPNVVVTQNNHSSVNISNNMSAIVLN